MQKLLAGMRDRGAQCAVVEYSAPEVFQGSCDWIEVSVAVHTTLDFPEQKMGSHGVPFSRKQLIEAALEPFANLSDSNKQAAVINLDDPNAELVFEAASAVSCITYSTDPTKRDPKGELVKVALDSTAGYKNSIWESEVGRLSLRSTP